MGPLASTRMACIDNNVSKQEDTYLKALGAATRYAYQDPYLLIYAEGFANRCASPAPPPVNHNRRTKMDSGEAFLL